MTFCKDSPICLCWSMICCCGMDSSTNHLLPNPWNSFYFSLFKFLIPKATKNVGKNENAEQNFNIWNVWRDLKSCGINWCFHHITKWAHVHVNHVFSYTIIIQIYYIYYFPYWAKSCKPRFLSTNLAPNPKPFFWLNTYINRTTLVTRR